MQEVGAREAPQNTSGPRRVLPSEPCGFEATYQELASAVKEQYPGIEIESRLGGTGEACRSLSVSAPLSGPSVRHWRECPVTLEGVERTHW